MTTSDIAKPALHSLAQKFRAKAKLAKQTALGHWKRSQWTLEARADARAATLEECAQEIERMKR